MQVITTDTYTSQLWQLHNDSRCVSMCCWGAFYQWKWKSYSKSKCSVMLSAQTWIGIWKKKSCCAVSSTSKLRASWSFGSLTFLVSNRQTAIWEPMDQAHISFQIHLPVISDVNNVTLSFPLPLALLPPMSLRSAMTQVWEVINRLLVWVNEP